VVMEELLRSGLHGDTDKMQPDRRSSIPRG
jgi:hypothetical protein